MHTSRHGSEDPCHHGAILVVDDQIPNLVAAEAVLAPLGQPMARATSAQEALRRCGEHSFSVILFGTQLDDLEALETVARIRGSRLNRETPMMLVGALAGAAADVSKADRHGAVAHPPRPYDPEDLRAKVSIFVELFRAKEQLREPQARREAEAASRTMDEFLATLSHELRSPLNAILLWVNLLRAETGGVALAGGAFETIERNTRLLAKLVDDLVDVSRIVAGRLEIERQPVEVVPLVEGVLESMRPAAVEKGIALESALAPCSGGVWGDAARLHQVVGNLVANAIKFTPAGGSVEVRVEGGDAQVQITVSDTGQGIRPEFLPYVFDRFRQADTTTTRAHRGLGLGLAIVRHLVDLHGGTVDAESPGEGQGARFTIRLPALKHSERLLLPA